MNLPLQQVRTTHPDEVESIAELHRLNKRLPTLFKLHGNGDKKQLALTFDDGPDKDSEAILTLLDEFNIKATFFVEGRKFVKNPYLVQKAYKAGHIIANHGYHHRPLLELTDQQFWQEEILATEHIFQHFLNYRPTLFRPPFGEINETQLQQLENAGITAVLWSVDSRDWDFPNNSVKQLVETTLEHLHNEAILLFHDGGGERKNTIEALQNIIPQALAQGYQFVTIDSLLQCEHKQSVI